jgi:hypothetical protein
MIIRIQTPPSPSATSVVMEQGNHTTGDSRKEQKEPPWNGTLLVDHSATTVVAQPLSNWKNPMSTYTELLDW